jgi:hypothetical protein
MIGVLNQGLTCIERVGREPVACGPRFLQRHQFARIRQFGVLPNV